jgi:adenylate cyclase
MRAWFRFRRFRTRLLVMLLGLLVAALGTTYLFVAQASYESALAHIKANLELGTRVYAEAVKQRIEYLEATANIMTTDYAIRQVLMQEKPDGRTLSSSLQSYTQRVDAPVIALFDTDGELLANSDVHMDNENRGPFAYLIRQATDNGQDEQHGFAYLNNNLHVLVVVPLYAPRPVIYKWFGLAFPIDRKFADKIKDTTRLELTFVRTDDPARPVVLASTMPPSDARIIAQAAVESRKAPDQTRILDLPGERYVTLFRTEEMLGDDPVTVVLQRPLSAELAATRKLESSILGISLAALAITAIIALGLARGISRPVQQLAAHTRHVAAGDYARRIDLRRADEFGLLATSFNEMSAGLAERDQVRDLLGKVVSPEIAAQLLKSGVELGGEEREVTILFSDLRDFTSWSEKLPAADVLALLNRYLDRMSRIVEQHGGVVDKYIGDAIMALFGAPLAGSGDADRAMAAAREMEAALSELNRELVAEGKPPLVFGIGINTALVVAGNMGSKTRLNYTVIGDGVNLASRLEGETKNPEHGTRIIVSEATLRAARHPPPARALGEVKVKGKSLPVKIFALNAKGESQPPHSRVE